ncbi:GNAT family N-acetyltransferase [Priestia koreensis]|uniref:GNAT family N-acetyltransferase n=1 Tax=Priestia koreensis TaxID=284581 RepID=UPI0034598EBE
MILKKLSNEDIECYWELRLRALDEEEISFVQSYYEAKKLDLTTVRAEFPKDDDHFIIGACNDHGVLQGFVGFNRETGEKTRHKGSIWGVYVAPEARGNGLAEQLMRVILSEAKSIRVEQVQLVVAASNEKAKSLYERLGFSVFGYEKNALKVHGKYVDEEHMVLFFT